MIQRMRNNITVNVDGVDLSTVTNIEVFLRQESTGVERLISGASITAGDGVLVFELPKELGMQLEASPIRAQIMFTRENGLPDATSPFNIPVRELMKEAGYGS